MNETYKLLLVVGGKGPAGSRTVTVLEFATEESARTAGRRIEEHFVAKKVASPLVEIIELWDTAGPVEPGPQVA